LRRGKEAIHSKYSKEHAVYMGDFLFSECFLMLSNLEIPKEVVIKLAEGISTICKAEMLQNYYRYDFNVTDEQYLKIISGKTAVLFGISLSIGAAQLDFDEEELKKIFNIGFNVGMAFQITDDILDFISEESVIGKDVKSDILKGYYTLPIILSFNTEYKNEIKSFFDKESLSDDDLINIYNLIHKSGALEKSKLIAENYTSKAINELNEFEESAGKKVMREILPVLLKRSY
jgi:heptaprenyl diphosphate synthase